MIDLPVYPRLSGDDNIRRIGIIYAYTPIVASVPEKSFARTIGLQAGDRLVELDRQRLLNMATLLDAMQEQPARAITLVVGRGTELVELKVPADRPKDTPAWLGASYRTSFGLKHTDPFTQLSSQVVMTVRTLWSLIHPHSDIGISKLSGPIGIGKIYWDASEAGIRYVLWIAILVNVNLAIFNLLPIPVLDGGHMMFATIGRLRGKALPMNFIAAAQSVFIVLLFSMIIYVSVFDVRRIARDVRSDGPAREAADTAKKTTAPAKP